MQNVTINNITKINKEWLVEFNTLGREQFYKVYNVLNYRKLQEILNKISIEFPPISLPNNDTNKLLIKTAPSSIPAWKLKSILLEMDIKVQVDVAIESLSETNKTIAKMAWNEGANIERISPLVEVLRQLLNLTNEQTDTIFTNAHNMVI